jgi:DNA-binding XRE family transcriptional regulator
MPGAGPVGAAARLSAAERAGADRDVGAILRGYRRACALTQQLADMLGYDRTYISMIESGRGYPGSRHPPTPEACMVLPSPQIPRRRVSADYGL